MNEDTVVTALDAAIEAPDTTAPQEVVKKKVQFNPEQQEKLEKLIRAAKSEAAKQLRAEHAESLREIATLKSSLNLPSETQGQLAAMSDKLTAATAEYTRISGLTKAAAKREALQAAATAANWFDASVGAKLIEDDVVYQDGALVVVGKDGEPRLNQYGEPLSVADLARERATQHPYMIKSTFKPGVGSTMQDNRPVEDPFPLADYFGKNAFGPLAHKLAKSDPRRYAAMRRAAVLKGLLPG